MKLAVVGCGYVADFYATTLRNHPELELVAAYDHDPARLAAFCAHFEVAPRPSLDAVLDDRSVELVLNLTNPKSHFEVSRAALTAGKHVYSEKPLALHLAQARQLVELAEAHGLELGSAPCTHRGEAAQTAMRALREGRVGAPRLAYAELDDGPIHLLGMRGWKSASGARWPWRDELEVGCALEHAGYYATWLVSMFGPVKRVTAARAFVAPASVTPGPRSPDLSIGVLEHASGVTSRLTCTVFASHDHSLRVFGDEGVLVVGECWDYGTRVGVYRRQGLGLKAERRLAPAHRAGLGLWPVPLVRRPSFTWRSRGAHRMDFARGPAELAQAVRQRRPSRLSAPFALHVNEIALALGGPEAGGRTVELTTRCEAPAPMPWACAKGA